MKTKKSTAMKRLVFLLTALSLVFVTYAQNSKGSVNCYAITMPKQDLSNTEKQALNYMRQKEKLAHDVYYTLYNKWSLPVFNNITASESRHTSIVKQLLAKYDLPDPVSDNQIGKFENAELQKLYNSLVQKGEKSLKDALEVGAMIEELDIKDLDQYLEKIDNDDIRLAFSNLRRGSTHHLKAFVWQLSRLGYSYEPKYLSKTQFDQIINQRKQNFRRPRYRYQNR